MNTVKQRWTFISYSRRDQGFALDVARELKSAGYLVWLDQLDIPTGARWDDEVERALRESEIFLIILTPASTSSENVKDEIGYAIDHGKRILPILMEECEVPLRLRRFQYIDFTKLEFREGVERVKQLLEILISEQSTPVVKLNPDREVQKVSDKEATPVAPLPFQNRPFRRRWIVGGIGILALTACLGALGAIIMSRGYIFSLLTSPQSQTSPTVTQSIPSTPNTSSPGKSCLDTIPIGSSMQCEMTKAGDSQIFSFESAAGDQIYFRTTTENENTVLHVVISGPAGDVVDETSSWFIEKTFSVPDSGAYSVRIEDDPQNTIHVNKYVLYMQRLNNPVNAQPLTARQLVSGSITFPLQYNAYTFEADTSEQVTIEVTKVAGPLKVEIAVYDPDGKSVADDDDSYVAEAKFSVSSSGRYLLLVYDGYYRTTGDYTIFLSK